MRRNRVIIAFVLIVALGCSTDSDSDGGSPPVKNSKPGPGEIAVLGDSLANGFGAPNSEWRPTMCLQNHFTQIVHDFADDGATNKNSLEQIRASSKLNLHLVFVSSGGNDAIADKIQPGAYPAEKSLEQMEQLFDQLLATGAVVAYLSLDPPTPGAERLRQITNLARAKGVVVIDGMNGLWTEQSRMFDRLHPNALGYQIMCQRILASLAAHYP